MWCGGGAWSNVTRSFSCLACLTLLSIFFSWNRLAADFPRRLGQGCDRHPATVMVVVILTRLGGGRVGFATLGRLHAMDECRTEVIVCVAETRSERQMSKYANRCRCGATWKSWEIN